MHSNKLSFRGSSLTFSAKESVTREDNARFVLCGLKDNFAELVRLQTI